jgi:maltooligosyltrehalose trehalohydrolase
LKYGATPIASGGVQFRVWAPWVSTLELCLNDDAARPLKRSGEDFELFVPEAHAGDRYSLLLDGARLRPDPWSRSQPAGVHGPSEVVDPEAFEWTDSEWTGIPLRDFIFYELHVGAFTPQGTFDGVRSKLAYLKNLGITAIELMPVAEFPGTRNWGYDGVDLYAPHSAYGGPAELKALVNATHAAGLAVVLDVVYNHLGPEGNYLGEFGPFFTDRYRTPWGSAINFDGPGSDGVRRFFIDNAVHWLREYHIDALRLDAIHGIFDFGARHFLAELSEEFLEEARALGRRAFLIAESDLNDVRVVEPREKGGYALDAQWHDEFHHSIVSGLTGTRRGFLGDFGRLSQVQKAISDGFVYDGVYSMYRGRHFGSSSRDLAGEQFVAFIQNHDQVANTAQGHRLSDLVPPELYRMAALLLLCSPCLPLLFMGEEFADTAPFRYFTSHSDPALAEAVSDGRRKEFLDFASADGFADPQAGDTFEQSRISWVLAEVPQHREVREFYQRAIALRKRWPCLANCRKDLTEVCVDEDARWLRLHRRDPSGSSAVLICNFGTGRAELTLDPGEYAMWIGTPPGGGRNGRIAISGRSAALYLYA